MKTSIPPVVPFVDLVPTNQPLQEKLERAIGEVVRHGGFILGKEVAEFEAEFAAASGVRYGMGVSCGTEAIALGLQAMGVGKGDEVLLPANTFVATLMGVIGSGATPVLVDCDLETALADFDAAARAVTAKTKAIVPVHLYGQMVDPEALQAFARRDNLLVLEDAAQAHLARRGDAIAGSIGNTAAYSFYPSKNLGAFGDGGIVLTDDEAIARRVRTLRNYGAPVKYQHTEIGKNSRLDTIQAAVLKTKLPYLKQWNRERNDIARTYDRLLAPLAERGIVPIRNESGKGHVYHLYVLRVSEAAGLDRDTLKNALKDRGILTGIHYPAPCHLQPAYRFLGYKEGDFPKSETLCRQILSLPLYPGLQAEQAIRVVEAIEEAIATC